jgi:hypothetical protein
MQHVDLAAVLPRVRNWAASLTHDEYPQIRLPLTKGGLPDVPAVPIVGIARRGGTAVHSGRIRRRALGES